MSVANPIHTSSDKDFEYPVAIISLDENENQAKRFVVAVKQGPDQDPRMVLVTYLTSDFIECLERFVEASQLLIQHKIKSLIKIHNHSQDPTDKEPEYEVEIL